ncbi:cytochrome P450 [Artomyces pyxidatus]|uniref:Cytochrome P450 n=1 Tax=Artomyces pyxidatus TaxID=48021 RepID=A0ACB8SZA8_9AGAM|nr:cytochrome P450 [Artomyces pyxidatus]
MIDPTLVVPVVALSLVISLIFTRYKRSGLPRPPGPKGLPLIGNLLDVPKKSSWLTYEEWGKTYGEIVSVEVFGQVIVILQSSKAARDLLEKRGAIYSDRPTMTFYEMAKWDWFLPIARSNDQWRTGRRLLERSLRPNNITQYRAVMKEKMHGFLRHLLSQPDDLQEHMEQYVPGIGAISMSIFYGYEVKDSNDELAETGREFVRMLQDTALPGTLLVNDFPLLRFLPDWLPGTEFKRLAKLSRKLGHEVLTGPLGYVKQSILNGTAQPSLALEDLQDCKTEKEERELAMTLGSLHAAGADATIAMLKTFVMVLVLFPHVQEKAQAELDAVTGGTRLPEFEDRGALPYIDALCKEVLRWQTIAPVALPHATTEDNVYNGYFIPKGSLVLANSWSILRDPASFPEPNVFRPERFLSPDGRLQDDPVLSTVFGYGKRICPGRHLIDAEFFIAAALVLSTFTIGKGKDAEGKDIPVPGTWSGYVVRQPTGSLQLFGSASEPDGGGADQRNWGLTNPCSDCTK